MIGNPGLVAMIEHHALLYRDLADQARHLLEGERDRIANAANFSALNVPSAFLW